MFAVAALCRFLAVALYGRFIECAAVLCHWVVFWSRRFHSVLSSTL
jgi:hypothetical protein